jgi:hypothetical protein
MPLQNYDTYYVPDGSAAAPGLPFAAEPQTGFYRKASGVVGLAVDGVEVANFAADGLTGGAQLAELTFTQTAGDGEYTGTIALPANSRILDIGVDGQALWDGTSASLIVGDGVDPDGFFAATDLKATDLLAGEINNLEHPGGKAGAYITAEQRVLYQAAARNVVAVLTQVGDGTLGRTRVYVLYAVGVATAAEKA